MRRITRSAIVECSARQVYDLVEDIESYPKFLPWCVGANVRERTPGRTVATITVRMPIPQAFTTENTNVPAESIDMRLVEGPFRAFEAHWRFTALGVDGAKIEFSIAYEFSDPFLAISLEPIFDSIAGTMVDAFTRRAEQLHGNPAN